jgi:hypothetical protein
VKTSCWTVVPLVIAAMAAATVPESRGDEPRRPYHAQWTWAEVQAAEPFQFVRFRKTFDLGAAPEKATAFVTADTFYRLWINERLETAARLGDHPALVRDIKAMLLPMVDTPPGTLWEDPVARIALCHSIACGVAGIMTEELLGIRFGTPIETTPHSGGMLRWCRGYMTTPAGRVEVAWQRKDKQYILRISLPDGVRARVSLPSEAKAVWQSAPAVSNWQDHVPICGKATIFVEPANVAVKQ